MEETHAFKLVCHRYQRKFRQNIKAFSKLSTQDNSNECFGFVMQALSQTNIFRWRSPVLQLYAGNNTTPLTRSATWVCQNIISEHIETDRC